MNNVLLRPIMTEKSMREAGLGKYTFAVDKSANKEKIAAAVKMTFGVKPTTVRTLIIQGEKKAIIQLVQGEKIDLFDTK